MFDLQGMIVRKVFLLNVKRVRMKRLLRCNRIVAGLFVFNFMISMYVKLPGRAWGKCFFLDGTSQISLAMLTEDSCELQFKRVILLKTLWSCMGSDPCLHSWVH